MSWTPSSGAPTPAQAPLSPVLDNGAFSEGTTGWRAATSESVLAITPSGRTGPAAEIRSSSGVAAMVAAQRLEVTGSDLPITTSVWVRTSTPGVRVKLKLSERTSDQAPVRHKSKVKLTSTDWTKITLAIRTERTSSRLRLAVRAVGLDANSRVRVDDVHLGGRVQSGGAACPTSQRGIPGCNAYAGGAYNSNTDPASWEAWLSGNLGVRRTYFSPTQIDSAAKVAAGDVAAGRVPWMSFKTPHSWSAMASGAGDKWAAEIGAKMAKVKGPVWIAIHHEPENDGGNIKDWTRMQKRLAPIIRGAGPNIGFTIILMGYHQFYGDPKFSLEKMWPTNTKVDVAGFDIYDEYGMVKNGTVIREHKKFRANYFTKIQRWALREGVDWGIAETGFTQASVLDRPDIMSKTFDDLVDTDGIAWAYFNTTLNTTADWTLNTRAKRAAFSAVHDEAATFE